MNSPRTEEGMELARALRAGLTARDRATRPPSFRDVWPSASRPAIPVWRKTVAAFAAAAFVAVLIPFWLVGLPGRSVRSTAPRTDAALARELSSADFWRVPSDELLAFVAPPLSAPLPEPSVYEVSLEDSLL